MIHWWPILRSHDLPILPPTSNRNISPASRLSSSGELGLSSVDDIELKLSRLVLENLFRTTSLFRRDRFWSFWTISPEGASITMERSADLILGDFSCNVSRSGHIRNFPTSSYMRYSLWVDTTVRTIRFLMKPAHATMIMTKLTLLLLNISRRIMEL